MPGYGEQLQALHRAIVQGDEKPMLPLIAPARHNEFSPQMRLDVYANAYKTRLGDAVREDYPATRHFMGKNRFEAAVRAYLRDTPSPYWDLNLYSVNFAEFINKMAENRPETAISALESAIVAVYWMPESPFYTPPPTISPEALLALPLRLRAASQLLALDYPAEEYLHAFREENPLPEMRPRASTYLVVRHQNKIRRHALEPAEYQALQQSTFEDALQLAATPEQAQNWLSRWISNGFLTG